MLRATTACTFSTSKDDHDRQKVARTCGNFNIFHQNVLGATTACTFFDICTSKSGPNLCGNFSIFNQNVLRATTACTFSTSQLPKVVRTWCVLYHFLLGNVLRATTACTFSTSQLPKVVRSPCFAQRALTLFTSKCASRHNGVHFFNISTSKSGPNPTCFDTFYFQMCFAPQRRALFHLSSGQLAPHPPL